ncbi:MAG TPA: DUF2889 domain-containing protein, partial [Desulfobacteraceae bacterium]|nr:DUF2889 domain-containing protein [Desulfobacteraceae bacterium]
MKRLDSLKKTQPLRERKMEFHTYPVENGNILVEGCFRDERLVGGYDWDGTVRKPGVVHLMYVRMLLAGWPLTIEEIEADMEVVPREICRRMENSVQKVKGLSISHGYTRSVLNCIGSSKGCTHLTHLVVSMGPASLHGYWTQKMVEPRPIPNSIEELPG